MSPATVTIAKRDRHRIKPGVWYHFAVYNFGQQSLTARLFENRKSLDWFARNRIGHQPIHQGRVRFK